MEEVGNALADRGAEIKSLIAVSAIFAPPCKHPGFRSAIE
jgi:hypothetical protein